MCHQPLNGKKKNCGAYDRKVSIGFKLGACYCEKYKKKV